MRHTRITRRRPSIIIRYITRKGTPSVTTFLGLCDDEIAAFYAEVERHRAAKLAERPFRYG